MSFVESVFPLKITFWVVMDNDDEAYGVFSVEDIFCNEIFNHVEFLFTTH